MIKFIVFLVLFLATTLPTEAQVNVIATHGVTRHRETFTKLQSILFQYDIYLIPFNLRGHGSRSKERIDYYESAKDLNKFANKVKSIAPDVPLYLLGESTGASVVMQSINPSIDGVILISPGKPSRKYNVFKMTTDFFKCILNLNKPVDITYYYKYIATDQRIIDELKNDPFNKNKLSGKEILRTWFFLRNTYKDFANIPVRYLVIRGKEDKLIEYKYKNALTLNTGHVILQTNYPNKEAINLIIGWLNGNV